jgi:hypothetical protein
VHPIFSKLKSDIRVWIAVFFIAQLLFITQPPLESAHNWRQSVTAMTARNMVQDSGTILQPRIDYGGSSRGIMATEFPLLQTCISGFIRLFGPAHWYGRFINLIFSCIGFWAFFKIAQWYVGNRAAFFGTLGLMVSLWLIYSRKIMPDTFACSWILLAAWWYIKFAFERKNAFLVLALLAGMLGVLSKIPAVLLFSFCTPILISSSTSVSRKLAVVAALMATAVPVYWWYFVWSPHLVAIDNNPLFFPRTFLIGLEELARYPNEIIQQFVFRSFFAYFGFVLAAIGIGICIYQKRIKVLTMLLTAFVLMFYFMTKVGEVFPFHSYYMVPFVPFLALTLGVCLASIKHRGLLYFLCLFLLVESLVNQLDDFHPKPSTKSLLELEDVADAIAPRSEKIVCNGGLNPQLIYFINRKGWSLRDAELSNERLESCKAEGAKYLFFYRYTNKGKQKKLPKFNYPILFENDFVIVFSLNPSS